MSSQAEQTEQETVTISIDGRSFEARPGELVIAAAERNGVYIPRFCWHPRMKPVGMCRMCLVQIEGVRGLPPACTTPVKDGMEVTTKSPEVKKAQDGVLEFLLINHPLDCPVCDRGGECPLQDQTFAFGPGESRFVEEKRHYAKPMPISDLVDLDRERCILCARCTRFADEVAGDPLISFVERGNETQVLTFPDNPFASYFSGNTVQICPVGALLGRPYRFRARPWDLEQVESTCTACAVGCRMAVQSSSNRLVRNLGVDSDAVNHGWLCDKGRFGYEAFNAEERLGAPLVRRRSADDDSQLVPTTWSEAIDAAASGLRSVRDLHGPGSLAVLGGSRLTNEEAYAWAKLAKGVLRTDSVDCQLGDGLPAELVLGLPKATIDDACRAPVVLLLGPDLKEELPVLYLRLRAAALEGGSALVELTPRSTGLTRYAKASLAYRPGEAAALVRALIEGSGVDAAGVPGSAIAAAAEVVRGADSVVVVLGRPSVAESDSSIAEAASVLAAALPGARFLCGLRRSNVHGALDMGLAPGLLPGRVTLDAARDWFAAGWPGLPEARGLDAAGILGAAAEGRLQGLVLLGADPLADFPDRALARRALAGVGFVVAVDLFLTESARWADVVLPAAGYAEKPGTTTNIEGRASRLGQKVTAPGTARPDWIIAAELAARLGTDLGFESFDQLSAEVARLAPAYSGVTLDVLGRTELRDGAMVPVEAAADLRRADTTPAVEESVEVTAAAAQSQTAGSDLQAPGPPQGRSRPVPPGAGGAPAGGSNGLARPPLLQWEGSVRTSPLPAIDAYSLRLVASRSLYDGGTLLAHSPSLAPLARRPELRVNHHDLTSLGVVSGQEVRVSSPRGSLTVQAVLDDGVPRGSAALLFNPSGPGAADLIDSSRPVTDVRVETR